MSGASLATIEQLGAYLKETITPGDATADLMLDIASGMVRDYLQRQIDYFPGDTVLVDNDNGILVLPDLPVTSVDLVETYDGTSWSTTASPNYSVSLRRGIISLAPNCGISWPTLPETFRVTYTHGYLETPMSIVGTVLGVAARAWTAAAGVDSEKIGGYQVKYSMEADGFTSLEMKALSAYINPRIA